MILPEGSENTKPQERLGGHFYSTAEIWQMFSACRAGDLEEVRHLVERCSGLVHCEYNYTPPIHFAVREGHAPLVRYLLDCGADPTYRTYRFKDSLLQMARERGYDEIAGMIEEVLAKRFPLSEEAETLLKAAKGGDIDGVRQLLDADGELVRASNETGDTALHLACAGGHAGVVELLLDRGADLEAVRSDGFKPIHSALFHNRQGYVRQGGAPTDTLCAGRIAGLLL